MSETRLSGTRHGPARFERRLTVLKHRELLVGRRDETPQVSPDILLRFKQAWALASRQLIFSVRQA